MPEITSLTVSRSAKLRTGNYETKEAFVSVTVEPEAGEDPWAVIDWAMAQVQRKLHEQEAIIRNGDEAMKLSDFHNREPRLPVLGTIRKGGARGTSARKGWKGGDDLDHFRVDFMEGEDSETAKRFYAVFGTEPTTINVWLPYPDLWKNWRLSFEAYDGAGTLVLATDGDEPGCTVTRCPGDPARVGSAYQPSIDPEVSIVGRLSVVVEELGHFAVLDFTTSSRIDCERITDSLKAIFNGIPANTMPLKLYRRPEEVTVRYAGRDGESVSQRKTLNLVNIELAPELVERRMLGMRARAVELASGGEEPPLMLDAGDLDDYADYVVDHVEHVDHVTGEVFEPQDTQKTFMQEVPAPEAPANEPHWIDDKNTRVRFWTWAKDDLNLSKNEVYEALGVDAVHDFQGDKRAAMKLLQQYADDKARPAQDQAEAHQESLVEWFGEETFTEKMQK